MMRDGRSGRSCGFRKYAAIIGVSVRATSSENSTATTTVKLNGPKNSPAMPLMNATGTNTATDRQRRRDDGETDLDRGVHRGLLRLLAHAQVPHDVLDLDDRVVDQDADDERQREQRQDVQRVAEHPDRPERRDDRQRQRDGGDGRGAPVAQEQPHDDDREDRAFDQHLHRGVERLLDVVDRRARLGELARAGTPAASALDDGARVLGDVERARAPRAHDLEADDGLAVEQRGRALLAGLVAHVGDRVEPHAAAVRQRRSAARAGRRRR